MSARAALIALLAALAATGCRALGVSQRSPGAVPAVPTLAVAQMVEAHNQNARLVQSLEATPSVSDRAIGSASGQMALVRPRDFRLTLKTVSRGKVAEVGSNDQEFWIWSANAKPKEYYVGHFDEAGTITSDLVLQPEWIIEALGLYVIPDEEARSLTTQRGDSNSTVTLVHRRVGPRDEPQLKKTIVNRETGRVVQHIFYAPDGKTVLARALPRDYRLVPVGNQDGESARTVVLPLSIRLRVTPPQQEPHDFSLALSDPKINQFAESRREKLFRVPRYEDEGYARVDLDQIDGTRRQADQVRETLPAPPAGARVHLDEPVPLGVDDQARRASDPAPLAADLPAPGGIDAVIGPQIPRPPGASDEPSIGDTEAIGGRLR
jgi:hypothetical protein